MKVYFNLLTHKVIAIHVINDDDSSFELNVNYVSYIYNLFKNNLPIQKGDIGIGLELLVLGVAKMNYKLTDSHVSDEIELNIMKTGGPQEVISISGISPISDAYNALMTGDIIYKLDNYVIGNNFLLIDQILNNK